ncbi:hypothetical protein DL93DRAFT_1161050 [Clavulina sp. PMI_390]|nr:hypothetical protein DL93DRAFT_1161050 [Clavulina sp. PMI_390]
MISTYTVTETVPGMSTVTITVSAAPIAEMEPPSQHNQAHQSGNGIQSMSDEGLSRQLGHFTLVAWTDITVQASSHKPTIIKLPPYTPATHSQKRTFSLVDGGYRTESYTIAVFHNSTSLEEVLGATSHFDPRENKFCGWLPSDVESCLAGGWSSGEFLLENDVTSVKVLTRYTARYTGAGESIKTRANARGSFSLSMTAGDEKSTAFYQVTV